MASKEAEESSRVAGAGGEPRSLDGASDEPTQGDAHPSKTPDNATAPEGGEEGKKLQYPKKPKMNKKQRRELQEKQRAEKAARLAAQGKQPSNSSATSGIKPDSSKARGTLQHDDSKRMAKKIKDRMVNRTTTQKQVALFRHLAQYERESSLSLNVGFSESDAAKVHPAIVALGLKYGDYLVSGANARAVAMLLAFKEVIQDYSTPAGKSLNRDLDSRLKPQIQFLIDCRQHSISMGNAIKSLRKKISKIPPSMGEIEAKETLCNAIDDYIRTHITMAQEEIIKIAMTKIEDGDVIMTYSRSHVVEQLLLRAHSKGIKFKVVVVSARPRQEGAEMLERLSSHGIDCAFILITAVSYMMGKVTKVVLGAGAMLSNGTVLARSGTASVALVANAFNKPVLVCCETYKFSERVQLDSITYNELGDPDDLILPSFWDGDKQTQSALSDWRDIPMMKLLNLLYDITAMEHVTMVITEVGMIPTTSVPVIVRERSEIENH